MLFAAVTVVLDRELGGVLDVLLIDLGVWVNIGKLLVLLLDPSEFDPAFGCPISEDGVRHRESRHQVKQGFLFYTLAESRRR